MGLGGGITFVPFSSAILSGVRSEQAGAAAPALQVSQHIGGALGVAVVVGVFAAASHTDAALADALAAGMLGAAGLAVLVAILAFAGSREQDRAHRT